MKDWRKTLITTATPIFEAIRIIDAGALQIALVIDQESRLIGIITDGDIRRGLLKGVSLDQPVHLIMKRDFTTVGRDASPEEVLSLMKHKDLRQVPVLDDQGRVLDLQNLVDMIQTSDRENWVVLMAGGLGTRL